jgi:hypothetical protein
MKKTLLTLAALTVAAGAFAQGTVTFNNRLTGTLITHVYAAPADTAVTNRVVGASSIDTPAGTTVYTGALLTGNGWVASLWSAPVGTTDASLLVQANLGTSSTFRTGTAAGNFVARTATLGNIAKDASAAVLQVRVWASQFATWELATASGPNGLWGNSELFTVSAIGGDVNTPPSLVGLTSFSLTAPVPEPTSMALAGLGAASLLIFRRRK